MPSGSPTQFERPSTTGAEKPTKIFDPASHTCRVFRLAQGDSPSEDSVHATSQLPLRVSLLVPGLSPLPAQTFLASPFGSTHREDGIMFDLQATVDVTICGLQVAIEMEPERQVDLCDVRVYTLEASHTNPGTSSWVEVSTATDVKMQGRSAPTCIPIGLDLSIAAGDTAAIYVTTSVPGSTRGPGDVLGTTGIITGTTVADDGNLKILSGTSVSGLFGPTQSHIRPSVIVQYALGIANPCITADLPVVPLPEFASNTRTGALEAGRVYVRSGWLRVPFGETLDVEPGAIIKMPANSYVDIAGTLNLSGVITSENDPIGGDLTGIAPQPGDWGGMNFRDTSDASLLSNAQIRYSGGGTTAAVNLSFADITIENTVLTFNGPGPGATLRVGSSDPCVTGNIFCQNDSQPVQDITFENLPRFTLNLSFDNQVADFFEVTQSTVVADTTVTPDNYPGGALIIGGQINIQNNTVVTIREGVVMKFRPHRNLRFICATNGTLRMEGSAAGPVVLTSLYDDEYGGEALPGNMTFAAPGDFQGLEHKGQGLLEHVIVRYAGANTSPGIEVRSGATVDAVVVQHCLHDGIWFLETPRITNVVVTNCGQNGILALLGTLHVGHATCANNLGVGIEERPIATLTVLNSISWNNQQGNYGSSLTGNDVTFSNGGFAGQNGNINEDPLFVGATVDLFAGSSSIDRGNTAYPGTRPITDVFDRARFIGQAPDMGAVEYSVARLRDENPPTIGRTYSFDLTGNPGVVALALNVFQQPIQIRASAPSSPCFPRPSTCWAARTTHLRSRSPICRGSTASPSIPRASP